MVNGTPSATPDAEPKLERMSRRTMPSCVSTFTPFEPSPGNGPAVSSGMIEQLVATAFVVVVAAGDVVVVAVAARVVDAAVSELPAEEQPATIAPRPAPPRSTRALRRVKREWLAAVSSMPVE